MLFKRKATSASGAGTSRALWSEIAKKPKEPVEHDADELIANFNKDDEILGWDHLVTVLERCKDLFGNMDLGGIGKFDYDRARSLSSPYWKAALEMEGKAKEASSTKVAGQFYSKKWKLIENAKALDRRISITLFEAKQTEKAFQKGTKTELDCDLHGQHQAEAVIILKMHVVRLSFKKCSCVECDTWLGEAQWRGYSAVKNAVKDYLKSKNIHLEPENKAGVFKIKIENIGLTFDL